MTPSEKYVKSYIAGKLQTQTTTPENLKCQNLDMFY